MSGRALSSVYMHWAKNQQAVTYHLASSEVPHFALDRLPVTIADLELDGASRHRFAPLRQAIAARQGVGVDTVVIANGTSMANFLAMATLIAPGDEVLVETPNYEPMVAAASFLGARITTFERKAETGFALDPSAVATAISSRTRLVLITNLHNPTSAFAGEAELRAVGAIAARHGARVLVDEVYLDAAFDAAPRSAALLGDTFVTTSSLTKVYGMSGIRCGWILADSELAERMWRLNELFGVAQPHAAEQLGILALEHLDTVKAPLPAHLARNRALARDFLASRDDLEGEMPPYGIVAFPRWTGGDVDALNDLLRGRYDTSIVPGRFFGAAEHFRFGIGGDAAMIEAGLARLGDAMDELTRR
ncbi:pyridoxal phosphate-dependent aminotransferase [Sphingoaurantiacus capsulatus]|uniref:Pyridoxal phosphate-dependent aminotransferase n=1 Tax=Sphingoaurantiacus capsulatus TaxID=1771310 RepID=A0ABV7XCV7_9SPHN